MTATVVRAQRPTSVDGRRRRARARGRHDRGVRRRRLRASRACAPTRCRCWRPASRCCCGSCPTADERGRRPRDARGRRRHGPEPVPVGRGDRVFLEPCCRRRGAGRRRVADRARRCARIGAELGLDVVAAAPGPSRRPATSRWSSPRTGATSCRRCAAGCEAGVPYVGARREPQARRGVLDELRGDGVPEELLERDRHARRARHRRAHAGGDRALDPRRIVEVRRAGVAHRRWRRAAAATAGDRPDLRHDRGRRAEHAVARARRRDRLLLLRRLQGDVRGPARMRAGLTVRRRARARRGRLDAASGGPSSCCPTASGTLLGHVVGTARACRFDQLVVRARRRRGRRARARSTCAASTSSSTTATATAARRRSPRRCAAVDPRRRPRAAARRPARRDRRRRSGALLAGRGDAPLAACRYDDGRGHPLAFARSAVRRPRRPARRQGRLAAARRARRRRRRGAGRRAGPARRRHVGGLRGGAAPARHEPARGHRRRRGRGPRASSPTSRRSRGGSADVDYLVDEGLATSLFLACACRSRCCSRARPASARPRPPSRSRRPRHAADPPAVLRGHRRRRGALRVELPAPAAGIRLAEASGDDAAARRTCSAPDYLIRRPLLRALEHPGPAARGAARSTRSTAPTTTSRRSCSSCSPRRA